MALVPVTFRELARQPYSHRLDVDRRAEFGAGYLSGADLGIDSLVLGAGTGVNTPVIWSPGFNTFMGRFDSTAAGAGTGQVFLEIWDPQTQVPVFWFVVAPAFQIADDTTNPFFIGAASGGANPFNPSQAAWVWILWRLFVINFGAAPATFTLELLANARETRT